MKKLLFLFLACTAFSMAGFSTDVKIGNKTDDILYVIVRFNDGTDCDMDDSFTICIPPYSEVTISEDGGPFSVSVYEGCPIPTGTESWHHNPSLGCSIDPVEVDPYTITWYDHTTDVFPFQWRIEISE